MQGFSTYSDLLDHVDNLSVPYRRLGVAPDGQPIVAAETGGDEGPAVVISAGAHATEHAGVRAAVELLDTLVTDHPVHVVPSRDPVGLNGYEYALETALGESVSIDSFDDVEAILRDRGEVTFDENGILLALLGDIGFATTLPTEDQSSCLSLMTRFKEFQTERPEVLNPYRGRRIVTPAGHPDVEETGNFGRAYTLVVGPEGSLLHLNRFFDREWAPVETRCVRRLMAEVDPVLVFDLHESSRQEERYHVSLRPPQSDVSRDGERRIAERIVAAVQDTGITIATDEDVMGGSMDVVGRDEEAQGHSGPFYSKAAEGAYWVDPHVTSPPRSGEGLNSVDFGADEYGFAFTTETGMLGDFEDRVRAAVVSVQAGIEAFDEEA